MINQLLEDVYFILSLYLSICLKVLIIIFDYFLYAAESKSSKKGETWQQGDLHPKDPNGDTGNPISGNDLDRNETLHQFSKIKT